MSTCSKTLKTPAKGRVVGCPSGWACQITTENLFKAYDMESAGFNLVDPGSGAALAGAIFKAYNRGEGVLAYYWAPTALLSKLDMVRVEMGKHNAKEFADCTGIANCPNPKPNSFPVSEIKTVVAADFAQKSPAAMAYLKARVWQASDFGAVLSSWKKSKPTAKLLPNGFYKTVLTHGPNGCQPMSRPK
jgi:ABC-type proline/glycine betaine transport systems, periplasmic components